MTYGLFTTERPTRRLDPGRSVPAIPPIFRTLSTASSTKAGEFHIATPLYGVDRRMAAQPVGVFRPCA